MEGIYDLFCFSIDKNDGELDDLVQIGPRVLFAGALEVQHTNDLRGGALLWWWGWWRPRSLALLAALAASGLDSRQSRAFRGERCCHHCRDECEAHVVPIDVRALMLQDCPEWDWSCCSGLLLTPSHASTTDVEVQHLCVMMNNY